MRASRVLIPMFVALVLLGPRQTVHGQILRLGGIDFFLDTSIEFVYTTNVEGERKSDAVEDREDYFYIASASLSGELDTGRNTSFKLTSDISKEKHFKRDDLDEESDPFGHLDLDYATEVGRYNVGLFGSYHRSYDTEEDTFVPGGKKKRDVNDVLSYGGNVGWEYGRLSANAEYTYSEERHDDPEFQEGDKDDTAYGFDIRYEMSDRLNLGYEFSRAKTDTLNDPDSYKGWDETQFIFLEFEVLERPELLYTLGYEKEDSNGEKGDWEITHGVQLSEDVELFGWQSLSLTIFADYQYEKHEEENDISFQYGLNLDHQINRTTTHGISATREPRSTLGSTTDTETTSYGYDLTKNHLFINDLNFHFGAGREISKPPDGPEETTTTYAVDLEHSRNLTRRISRVLSYRYSVEDNDTEDEKLDEHRFSLLLTYSFD